MRPSCTRPAPIRSRIYAQNPWSVHAKRNVHSSIPQRSAYAASHDTATFPPQQQDHHEKEPLPKPTLSTERSLACLSLPTVLRTYFITVVSSSPFLLDICFAVLNRMLRSKSALMDPDRNAILGWALQKTFYAQFCAGENRKEVERKLEEIRNLGYEGVILEYALEVLGGETAAADSKVTEQEIEMWRQGMLETVRMTKRGDFIGLKWSGMGSYALQLLKENKPPTPSMERAINEVCDLAAAKGVALLPSAELEDTRAGYDSWTLTLQKRYNDPKAGRAIMYSTYQCYLRSTPSKIARDLARAEREGYLAGVKLVRGAYMKSEPRNTIWGSKEETDECYDAMVDAVLRRKWNSMLRPASEKAEFPPVNVMIASHNHESVKKAQKIRNEQAEKGEGRVRLAYAQLQGMADEVSCELVKAGKIGAEKQNLDSPKAFKCMPWGTSNQCLNYLMRRAAENRDAVARTADTRRAMGQELWRRLKGAVGFA